LEPFSLSARVRSFRHALSGIWITLSTQHNAWIHAAATVAAIGAGLALRIERGEWLAVALAIMAVWTASLATRSRRSVMSPRRVPSDGGQARTWRARC
jgi:diacylglycerol kinase (ATP)